MQEVRQEINVPGAKFPLVKETGSGTKACRDNYHWAQGQLKQSVSHRIAGEPGTVCVCEREATGPILVICKGITVVLRVLGRRWRRGSGFQVWNLWCLLASALSVNCLCLWWTLKVLSDWKCSSKVNIVQPRAGGAIKVDTGVCQEDYEVMFEKYYGKIDDNCMCSWYHTLAWRSKGESDITKLY